MTPLPLCSMAKGKKATDTARNYLYAEVLAVKIPIKLNNLFQTFQNFQTFQMCLESNLSYDPQV